MAEMNIVYKIAADISGLQQGVNRAAKATESLQQAALNVGAAMGIGFSVGSVVTFGRTIVAAGDNFKKMADQTGLSTDAVQKLNYIADQSSVSIGSLIGAVQNLQQRLGDDNSGAAAAIRKLGINMAEFNQLDSYQQMTALGDAINAIRDPTEQASLAAAIFGKNWKEILPAIKSGMKEVGDEAPIMAQKTIDSLAKMDDAINEAKAQGTALFGTLIGALADFDRVMLRGREEILNVWSGGLRQLTKDAEAFRLELEKLPKSVPALARSGAAPLTVPTGAEATAQQDKDDKEREERDKKRKKALDDLNAAAKRAADEGLRKLRDRLNEIDPGTVTFKVVELTDAVKDLNTEAVDMPLTEAVKDLASEAIPTFGQLADAIRRGPLAAFGELADEIRRLERTGLSHFIGDLRDVGTHVEVVGTKAHDASDDLGDLSRAFAQMAQVSGGKFGGIVEDVGGLITALNAAEKAVGLVASSTNAAGGIIKGQFTSWAAGALGVATAMLQIGLAIQSMLDGVIGFESAYERLINNTLTGGQVVTNFFSQFTSAQDAVEKITAAYIAQGMTAEDARAAVQRLMDATRLGGEAAKRAVEELNAVLARQREIEAGAGAFGLSRSQLQAAAQKAHEVFDFMLASGEYTAEQLTAAFRAFQEALAAAGDEAAKAWLKANEAAEGATNAATKGLDALKSKRDTLAGEIAKEAPEEVMGVIETQMRGELAALDAQIADQQQQMEESASAAADAIETIVARTGAVIDQVLTGSVADGLSEAGTEAAGARNDIENEFSGFEIRIPIYFDRIGDEALGFSSGGIVPSTYAGSGALAFQPMGTDTVPAMLTPGEMVLTKGQQRALSGRSESSVVNVHAHLSMEGRELTTVVINDVLADKRGAGTRLKRGLGLPR